MKLRIVTWNCNQALHKKAGALMRLEPDIAIIQECADWEHLVRNKTHLPCRDHEWMGFNPNKGLAIFSFGDYCLQRYERFVEELWCYLPVHVTGPANFNVLGVWMADFRRLPAGGANNPPYAIEHYWDFLSRPPSIVAGDFNILPRGMWNRNPRRPDEPSSYELLSELGLVSAYHAVTGEAPGHESTAMHYHKRHVDQRRIIHADYTFVPAAEIARLPHCDVGKKEEWLDHSDHMPMLVGFELTPGSAFLAPPQRPGWFSFLTKRR